MTEFSGAVPLRGEYMRPRSANMFIDFFSHTHTPSFLAFTIFYTLCEQSIRYPTFFFILFEHWWLAGSKRHINTQSFPNLHRPPPQTQS